MHIANQKTSKRIKNTIEDVEDFSVALQNRALCNRELT